MQGYRVLIFNAALAILALVRAIWPGMLQLSDEDFTRLFDAIWMLLAVAGNFGLRFVTKGPVGVKDPECK